MLDSVNAFLVAQFGELGPLFALGFLGLLLILIALPTVMKKTVDPLDRLKATKQEKVDTNATKKALRQANKDKLAKYSKFLEPESAEEYSAVRLKLLQAGYRSKNAVRTYHFLQFALGIGLLIVGVMYAILRSAVADPSTQMLIMMAVIPGAVGYMLPKYWVTKRQQERQEKITNGFPDSLDMMLVCVEAGQSMDQSILRVSKEIRAGFPALADEYEIVAQEMKAGKEKTQVLRDMAERAGVPDVASFVTVLIQSATFGTSVAEALRVYASEMRDKRVMRAEEKANTLPTKMTLATMMMTVPPLLIILLGPSVYEIAQTMGMSK